MYSGTGVLLYVVYRGTGELLYVVYSGTDALLYLVYKGTGALLYTVYSGTGTAGIQDEIRLKNRLRRQWQITRETALKAEVNRLQKSETRKLNE